MRFSSSVRRPTVSLALLAVFAACGSSNSTLPIQDSAQGGEKADAGVRDSVGLPDAASDTTPSVADAVRPLDGQIDVAQTSLDARLAGDGGTDSGPGDADETDVSVRESDGALDGASTSFQPGPAIAVVLNSGNTAEYNLADGTWKVFYFDAEAGQLYVISGLSGISRGYLSTSPSVSPSNYQTATDAASGVLYLTAPAAQRIYLAVGVSGGGASGSFQVADGGRLLALGTTTLSLTPADAGDAYLVYRFPISTGLGYRLDLSGPSQPNLGLSVAARPERSSIGEFSYSKWSVTGSLPFNNEEITTAMVAEASSGFYFLNLRIMAPIMLTISIAQNP